MSTKTTPPEIESIPFKDLVIDTLYSGRDEKEIRANAKELSPALASGWDATQPGQYFIGEDGKKHVVAGFTRIEAAKANDLKSGFFVKVDGDEVHHLTACIRTNQGKPISRRAQGERFISLRDGVVAEDFAGTVADPKNDADWKRKPLTLDEIAALPGVGKSTEHIKQCILVAEDDVFAAYEDEISVNAFISARQLVNKHHDGSNAKLEKVIRAAVKAANDEGKDKATPKHFDAVKADFIPAKKLVAAPVASENTDPATESADAAPESSPVTSEPENKGNAAPEQPELISETHETPKPKGKKAAAEFRKALETLLLKCSEDYSWSATDDDISGAADQIEALYAKADEVF